MASQMNGGQFLGRWKDFTLGIRKCVMARIRDEGCDVDDSKCTYRSERTCQIESFTV